MSYNLLKFIHAVSATFLLGGFAYSLHLWRQIRSATEIVSHGARILYLSWALLLPCAFLQFGTGFTLISLKHYSLSATWIDVSLVGFMLVISSWGGFLYCLSQQLTLLDSTRPRTTIKKHRFFRQVQAALLGVCIFTLLCMIFYMSNKIN